MSVRGVAPVSTPVGGFAIDGNLIANQPDGGTGDWLKLPSVPTAVRLPTLPPTLLTEEVRTRTKKGPIDYQKFFAALARLAPGTRQFQRDDNLIALPQVRLDGGRAHLVAYEGPVGVQPLIFDAASAQERIQRLRAREVVATRTHCVIDLASRESIVEYNHRGAKANDLVELLARAGRSLPRFKDLDLDLNPKVSESFLAAIGRFERVRVAITKRDDEVHIPVS